MNEIEQWLEIKGFEGHYAVSTHGRVMSMERKCCGTIKGRSLCRIIPETIMIQHDSFQGYKQVWLRKPGERKKCRVHRLVAQAFLPNPEGKEIVNHLDGDKGNCNVLNLEWATGSENTLHWHHVLRPKAHSVIEDEEIRPEDLPF